MTTYSDWEAQFDRQIQAQIKADDKTIVDASRELLSNIERRTPIGRPELWSYKAPKNYKPGTLRASWVLDLKVSKGKIYINISNDQPYSERVEHGWSTQAPKGMLRVSLLEWPNLLAKYRNKN